MRPCREGPYLGSTATEAGPGGRLWVSAAPPLGFSQMVFRGRRGGGIASRSAPASAGTPPARPKTEAPGKRVPRPGLWLQEQQEQQGRRPPRLEAPGSQSSPRGAPPALPRALPPALPLPLPPMPWLPRRRRQAAAWPRSGAEVGVSPWLAQTLGGLGRQAGWEPTHSTAAASAVSLAGLRPRPTRMRALVRALPHTCLGPGSKPPHPPARGHSSWAPGSAPPHLPVPTRCSDPLPASLTAGSQAEGSRDQASGTGTGRCLLPRWTPPCHPSRDPGTFCKAGFPGRWLDVNPVIPLASQASVFLGHSASHSRQPWTSTAVHPPRS